MLAFYPLFDLPNTGARHLCFSLIGFKKHKKENEQNDYSQLHNLDDPSDLGISQLDRCPGGA